MTAPTPVHDTPESSETALDISRAINSAGPVVTVVLLSCTPGSVPAESRIDTTPKLGEVRRLLLEGTKIEGENALPSPSFVGQYVEEDCVVVCLDQKHAYTAKLPPNPHALVAPLHDTPILGNIVLMRVGNDAESTPEDYTCEKFAEFCKVRTAAVKDGSFVPGVDGIGKAEEEEEEDSAIEDEEEDEVSDNEGEGSGDEDEEEDEEGFEAQDMLDMLMAQVVRKHKANNNGEEPSEEQLEVFRRVIAAKFGVEEEKKEEGGEETAAEEKVEGPAITVVLLPCTPGSAPSDSRFDTTPKRGDLLRLLLDGSDDKSGSGDALPGPSFVGQYIEEDCVVVCLDQKHAYTSKLPPNPHALVAPLHDTPILGNIVLMRVGNDAETTPTEYTCEQFEKFCKARTAAIKEGSFVPGIDGIGKADEEEEDVAIGDEEEDEVSEDEGEGSDNEEEEEEEEEEGFEAQDMLDMLMAQVVRKHKANNNGEEPSDEQLEVFRRVIAAKFGGEQEGRGDETAAEKKVTPVADPVDVPEKRTMPQDSVCRDAKRTRVE